MMCEWFALCTRPASGVVAHPILGNVPTCARCAARHELTLVPYGSGEDDSGEDIC
jgi:hypothetical protein